MAKKSVITATSRSAVAASSNEALMRRLKGNVHAAGSRDIRLKEPQAWATYIANSQANINQQLEMRDRGWVPVEESDLAVPVDQSGFRLENGMLVRGVHGQEEYLWKMPKSDHNLLMQAKTEANLRGIGSKSKVKSDMVEALATAHGDEAASFMNSLSGNVIDTVVGPEAE